jgi:hypothetical protein
MSNQVIGFWGMMAVVVVLAVGFWAADYAGSSTESVWVAAGAGLAMAIVVGYLAGGFQAGRRGAAIVEKWVAKGGTFSAAVASGMCVVVAALGAFFILDFRADEFGRLNYTHPAIGGFWIGVAMIGVWNIAMIRKSRVAP